MTIFEGAAVLGALAWIPYLLKLIKDWVTRPEIRMIGQRTAEIGYTTFGPILNLRIAFPVRHRDIVISSIKIRLRHESGEEKILSWQGIVQRLFQMQTPEVGPIPLEKELSALAIKLSEKEVEERLIRFQENDYHTNKEIYESKAAKKLTYLKGKGEYTPDEFLQSEEMKDVYSFIKHWFNWKQGKYTVTFEVESPEKFVLKDNVYEFSLNPLNIELLEANKELIPLAFEDQLKIGIEGYQSHKINWNWVNPVLKKMT
jgi:hypothetical protein